MRKSQKFKSEEEAIKKLTIMWIDNKQRTMKGFIRKMYNNLFTWRGVWRNRELFDKESENVPVKIFNFVTQNLSKPILKNMLTQGLCYYDEDDTERIIRRKHKFYKGDNWRLLNCKDVFADETYCELSNRLFSKKITREDIDYLKKDYVNYLEKFAMADCSPKETILCGKIFIITEKYRLQMHIIVTHVCKKWKNSVD